MNRFCFALLVLLLANGFLAGCEKRTPTPISQVSGIVTHRGKPISRGDVNFMSDEGFGMSASLDRDGRFQLRSHHGNGIPHGLYKVTVTPPAPEAVETLTGSPPQEQSGQLEIPAKYQSFATSGLEFTVKDGPHTFELNLDK